jgi:hypothetical protein
MGTTARVIGFVWLAFCAGCSCSSPASTTPDTNARDAATVSDAGVDAPSAVDAGSDAGPADMGNAMDSCTPPADNAARGSACTGPSDCPAGYDCQASFTAATTCDITCVPATAACVCPTGLSCETPTGHATGICS